MNIQGTYETNNGAMKIENHGDHIIGKYAENGILKGTLIKNAFEGEWDNNGQQGLFQFEFAEDGTFIGKYKKGLEPGLMRGKWTGKLISANELIYKTPSEINDIEPKDNLSEENREKSVNQKSQVQEVEKEKKKKSDPGYLAQLHQKEDYAFLCECVDTSINYSPNIIEKILDASLKSGNEEIEKYCFDQWKLKGDNISKMKDYDKWTNVRKIIKEKSIDEKYRSNVSVKIVRNDKVNGEQKYEGGDTYKGEIENGRKNGKGTYYFANGDFYNGLWEDDKFISGIVKTTNSKGWVYKGESLNNQRHGIGKLYNPKGELINDGRFINDVFESDLLKVNGEQKYEGGDTYKGEIENGRKNGKGTYYFANGDFYNGLWEDDKFIAGIVKQTNRKGWVYEGEYLNNQRHGIGKLYNPKGELIDDGRFINDVFEGDLLKNLAEVKDLIKKFAKTHGYSSILGKLFSGGSNKDLDEFKANIKEVYSKGDYKKVVKECVEFIEKEESLSKTEPALYYLLLAGEKLDTDQNSFWDLAKDIYNKHNSKRINSFFVKSFLRETFKQLDEYIVLITDKGDEYYTDKLLYKGYTFPLGKEYKPLLETNLRLFEQAREKVSYQDDQLEKKINLCEKRTKNTLAEIDRWEEFATRNRAENENKKKSPSTSSSSSKISEQKKDTVQGSKFEITYEIKLKEDASFGNTFKAQMEAAKKGQSFFKIMKTADGKGGFREKSIIVNHDKNTLSNADAKNYIVKNDRDVQIGVAGSSTVKIVKIKML